VVQKNPNFATKAVKQGLKAIVPLNPNHLDAATHRVNKAE
jgi:hypothetical protein